MKYLPIIGILLLVASCGTQNKSDKKKPLYEILTQQPNGGANIRFYEILTEQKEVNMLLNDEFLANKVSAEDIKESNFLILNMGEKTSGGYSITVDSVTETPDKILVKVKENEPEPGSMTTQAMTYPYAIVKINSKKPIEIE